MSAVFAVVVVSSAVEFAVVTLVAWFVAAQLIGFEFVALVLESVQLVEPLALIVAQFAVFAVVAQVVLFVESVLVARIASFVVATLAESVAVVAVAAAVAVEFVVAVSGVVAVEIAAFEVVAASATVVASAVVVVAGAVVVIVAVVAVWPEAVVAAVTSASESPNPITGVPRTCFPVEDMPLESFWTPER